MNTNVTGETPKTDLGFHHAKTLLRYLICALSVATVNPAISAETDGKKLWREASSLPYRIQEIYPTVFDGHIVVAGGLSPDVDENRIGVSDRVLVYSIEEQTWKDGPKLPEPRHHPMLVVVDNRLLSFGGFIVDEEGAWHNSVDVLELVTDTGSSNLDKLSDGRWEKITQLPAPLAETLSAVNDGMVHLVSGRTPIEAGKNSQWNDQSDVATHYVFNPNDLSWSMEADLPTARNSACSVTIKGNLHTIGGRTVAGGNLPSHEVYNFKSEKWQTLSPLPQAQGGLACAASDERIYVFGGEFFNNGGGVYSEVWQYDIVSDRWGAVSSMPNPRHGLGALTVDGSIYVIAGASQAGGNETSDAMTIFLPGRLKGN